jgi:hypothetical protein
VKSESLAKRNGISIMPSMAQYALLAAASNAKKKAIIMKQAKSAGVLSGYGEIIMKANNENIKKAMAKSHQLAASIKRRESQRRLALC